MMLFKKIVVIVLLVVVFINCGSKQQLQMEFSQQVADVYYEKELVADQNQADRIVFHIELTEPLSSDITLNKVYFRNQEADITKVTSGKYLAYFNQTTVKKDIILDSEATKEYGNEAPIIVKPKFHLKQDEVILEYHKNNKQLLFKLTGIGEKE